jgi:PAS domain S-box-containing protein
MSRKSAHPRELGVLFAFLDASNSSVVITEPAAGENPIVYANPAFERMTGYPAPEAVGRDCRFLQGEDRDQPGRRIIAAAMAAGSACECLLRNYRKDGVMFWNMLYVFPFRMGGAAITHFVGVQHDVTAEQTLLARLDEKRTALARLSLDLIDAQESERKALARELHDELGQRLAALNMLLHRSRPWFGDADGAALWSEAEREMTSLAGLVRDLSASLRPPDLDYFGLEVSLRQLLARQFDRGPAWTFAYAGLPQRLPSTIEISVYRIVQESVTNIVRHARARRVVVEIDGGATGDEVKIAVRDDGVGFDAAGWRELAARTARAGLAGMRERVELLGGSFAIDSRRGAGTRIAATVPLRPGG